MTGPAGTLSPSPLTKGFVINIHNVRVMKAIMMTCARITWFLNKMASTMGMNPHKASWRGGGGCIATPLPTLPSQFQSKYVTGENPFVRGERDEHFPSQSCFIIKGGRINSRGKDTWESIFGAVFVSEWKINMQKNWGKGFWNRRIGFFV